MFNDSVCHNVSVTAQVCAAPVAGERAKVKLGQARVKVHVVADGLQASIAVLNAVTLEGPAIGPEELYSI